MQHLFAFFHSSSDASIQVHSQEQEVAIALGSNVGDRLNNFNKASRQMKKSGTGINVRRHACLYETEPTYVTDQPCFLNSAIRVVTKLSPHELLLVLKEIEKEMG
ncbi:putative 7,8-Dihydro-6-hydroxymethylpterin-pyrophosphokinase, HPPK [Helianthus annuus]|uniref:2-amino-4-hydroxy-6-hydroxymethyldihydropteridine diphosphokinase n=1 Tax=Helianthus annuus TaxID=4232 RepID=A0A251S8A5_HELAN|nr:putative 7,8-Dihydro-6-hydroxymethylpterin-pyrophosphokinase, HPPK [Helianthus annuus]KAJ0450825.1 putative 7,8-Dihydro-6-hydroxymethylpterin-pyrophosphokinase, HPPK [Helianthus annuus]KAJ0455132.1 putative 7,8-Dihydro-6-hydroxymethylpterin-pyrophosphokinase, HPPK [Helianthus annuus]KAJ0472689.1 putative 7,8-Dihydro-6-hydroxymethylpterin-pyrophosphokinase, HPPK [Helianthus annuus]KAJ0630000.1 putative 7,8-Dihydro-6-hydroxymethylpterin-pyrophosphokinase, HPPK [Helianthus annuus]